MKKIKVLHIVSSLSIDSGVMGVIMNYYRHIDRNRIQFDFLYFIESEKNYKDEIVSLGGSFYLLPKPSLMKNYEYKNFFKERAKEYKVVHLHEIYLNSIILPIARKNEIKNLITHSHATKFSDKKLNAIRNKILCLPLKKQATLYLACSKAAGNSAYGKKYVNSNKFKVINNAINIERFKFNQNMREEVRSALKVDGKFIIGHVGRFKEQKNHIFLLQIFAELKKRKDNILLMLIGDGPLYESIKQKAKELGLEDSVLFLGNKDNIQDYLQAMDVFILPSLFEGLPVVGVEAQTSGLPIILSTNITREIGIINYSYLELTQSADYWASTILKINQNNNRLNSYKKVMEAGFDIIEESKKLDELYSSLI